MAGRRTYVAVLGAVLSGLSGLVPATSAAATTHAAAARATPAAARGAAASGGTRQVTLVTGDVLTVATGPDGRPRVTATAPGGAGAYETFGDGTHLYVVPASASAYVPRPLDLSLFDVTARAGESGSGLRVRVTYRHGAVHLPVPGVRVTGTSGDVATGVVTPASAARLGAALDAARTAPAAPWLAAVIDVTAADAAVPTGGSVTPAYDMRTLTVHAVDPDGGDTVHTGRLLLWNVDDARRYTLDHSFFNEPGEARFSVPTGHYGGVMYFDELVWKGFEVVGERKRFVAIPELTVRKDTTVTVDARTATEQVTVATPRPVTGATVQRWSLARDDALGATRSFGLVATAPFDPGYYSIWVTPTRRAPRIGALHTFYGCELVSPPDETDPAIYPYTYDVGFAADGVIAADQAHVLRESDLARVDTRYRAERAGQVSGWADVPVVSEFVTPVFAVFEPFTTPSGRTTYVTTDPRVRWQSWYLADYTDSKGGEVASSWRRFAPGQRLAETWLAQPLHPSLVPSLHPNQPDGCPMCTGDGMLYLWIPGFGDNDPGHANISTDPAGYTDSFTYGVHADGVAVASGTVPTILDAAVPVPAGARQYRITYDMTRSGPNLPLSDDVRTEWTVPARLNLGALPAGWACRSWPRNTSSDCAVLPALTARYDLPVDDLGRVTSGDRRGTVTVAHLAGVAALPVGVSVELSYDGGAHWTGVPVTPEGHGRFGFGFTAPPAAGTDGYAALRLTAHDATGSRLVQTIHRAFAVSDGS